MSGTLVQAWLLHRRPYRDTSALVDFLVAGRGRLRAVARGVFSAKSRLAQCLQPFSPLAIELGGRGELLTLTKAESDGAPLLLAGEALLCGFYLNELLVRLLAVDEECDAVLAAYGEALNGLLMQPKSPERALRSFEMTLLEHLGLAVDWQTDGRGSPIIATQAYHFVAQDGWLPGGVAGRQVAGRSLLAMVEPDSDAWWASARSVFRLMLDSQLGDKPLQSRVLLLHQRKRTTA